MAYDFNGSSQQISTTSTPINNEPLTLAIWFYSDQNTSNREAFNIVGSVASDVFALNAAGATAGDPLQAYKGPSPFPSAVTTTGFDTTNFFHGAGVFAATAERFAYINGGSKGTNTTSLNTAAGSYSIGIGRVLNSTASAFDGRLAEAAIWNVALTDDEIASLAKGFKPTRIRPQSLVFYAPLIRDLQDVKGALTLTNNNSATVANHPRVY